MCSYFSDISGPFINLLSKKVKFIWDENCERAFCKIKAILQTEPVLSAPDFYKSFKLAVDASDIGVGGVLLQEDTNGIDHTVCYFSRKLTKHQKKYSTIEKGCLALLVFTTL